MINKTVKEFITRHLPQSPRIIVGLSGGADSMALMLALAQSGVQVVAAHCNFHLRGEESERDCRHCESVCRSLGVKLIVKDFDVERQCRATSESVEMACRTLRYDWWRGLISSSVGDYIAVGHHREDNVETLMLNLLRGSGIAGLKGMLPVNGNIIRPLLEVSRADIERYVADNGYTWVTDRTNNENEYKRNRLRNIILPLFEREFPGASDSMVKSLGILRANYALYRSLIASHADRYIGEDKSLLIGKLVESEREARALMHEILPDYGFNHSQIDDIYACATSRDTAESASGQRFATPQGPYVYERGILTRVIECCDAERYIELGEDPTFELTHLTPSQFRDELRRGKPDRNTIYLDAAALDGTPRWSVRPWRQGDRLAPFGMKGTRLVSDIFTDAKFSTNDRHATPLLFRDGVLMWVVGVRASRHFKVTDSTSHIIKLTLEVV